MKRMAGGLAAVVLALSLAATDALADWQLVENKANCAVWISYPTASDKVTWTGARVNGKADGKARKYGDI